MAGMLVFIAFPLVYTAVIGFTNYSSPHLLTEERVREYLLDQHEAVEDLVLPYSLHADGSEFRLVLRDVESGQPRWVSTPLALRKLRGELKVELQEATTEPAQAALPLREQIQHREALSHLVLQLPGQLDAMRYLGLREFGPVRRHWESLPDGSLKRVADGQIYKPNGDTGFFENAGPINAGEALQPGYKVLVGTQNYKRMLLNEEFRGPFLAIFTWTVVFSFTTVLFATAIGMLLAVMLNWEDLKYRGTYRTLLFLPYAVPGFISILVFKGLFNQNFGEINAILDSLVGVKPAWFADPLLAKIMLVIVNVWLGYPYVMILCSGLLKAIPADLYEASALAGATPLDQLLQDHRPADHQATGATARGRLRLQLQQLRADRAAHRRTARLPQHQDSGGADRHPGVLHLPHRLPRFGFGLRPRGRDLHADLHPGRGDVAGQPPLDEEGQSMIPHGAAPELRRQ